jgi:hypothetical protein
MSKSGLRALDLADRQTTSALLRARGWSYSAIGAEQGISSEQARQDCDSYYDAKCHRTRRDQQRADAEIRESAALALEVCMRFALAGKVEEGRGTLLRAMNEALKNRAQIEGTLRTGGGGIAVGVSVGGGGGSPLLSELQRRHQEREEGDRLDRRRARDADYREVSATQAGTSEPAAPSRLVTDRHDISQRRDAIAPEKVSNRQSVSKSAARRSREGVIGKRRNGAPKSPAGGKGKRKRTGTPSKASARAPARKPGAKA